MPMTAKPMETSEQAGPPPLLAADRVAVVAGSGILPEEIAAKLAEAGKPPLIVALDGETSDRWYSRYEHVLLGIEELPDLISILQARHATHVVLAGGVARRPDLWKIRRNFNLFRLLARFVVPLARGDDNLLKAVISYIEKRGIKVVGAHEIVPDLMAAEGALTSSQPARRDWQDIEAARMAARTLGSLDIGQAAVAIGGRAVALEDIDGTDALLSRVKGLRSHGRLAGKKRGVLVKCTKPGQELRADLPTIGPATIEAAYAAELAGVAVDAGRSFILEQKQTIARADQLGLFIVGLPPVEN